MNSNFELVSDLHFNETESDPANPYMEVRLANKNGGTNSKAHVNNKGKILVKWEEEQ